MDNPFLNTSHIERFSVIDGTITDRSKDRSTPLDENLRDHSALPFSLLFSV